MKFSQRLFLLLFLLGFLQNSFAQAGVYLTLPDAAEQQQMHQHKMSHHQAESHDCCDETVEKMAAHVCQFCGDDCQCLNDCHVSTASLVLINAKVQGRPYQPEVLIKLTDSPLFSVDASLEKRPPRLA